MEIIENFQPDLVIETTNACDKQCLGCYAPNVLVNDKITDRFDIVKNLEPNQLRSIWSQLELPLKIEVISVRGGEPTLNPHIVDILEFLRDKADNLILETNGDWILKSSKLINELDHKSVNIKLSADRMHGSILNRVESQLQILQKHQFITLLAVTAESFTEFEKFYRKLNSSNFIPVFQKKAFSLTELIQPKIGVISASGKFKKTLTTTNSFRGITILESFGL